MRQPKGKQKMQTTYEIDKGLRFREEDIFESGCIDNGGTYVERWRASAGTLDQLIEMIMEHCGTEDKKNVLLNSCDEKGRIDVQVYETEDGTTATEADMAQWKKGKCRLWLTNYSFHVERVQRESDLDLSMLVSNVQEYTFS